jgi:hypothetical protein
MSKKPKNSSVGHVPVTSEHIDRALRAMTEEVTNLSRYEVDHETRFIAGAIIANLEALDERMRMSSVLMAVVHDVLTDYVSLWAMETYGLVQPKGKRARRAAKAAA